LVRIRAVVWRALPGAEPVRAETPIHSAVCGKAAALAHQVQRSWAADRRMRSWTAGTQGVMREDTGAAVDHRQSSDRGHQNTSEGVEVRLHEEEVTATKTAHQTGAVRIEKDVVSEEQTLSVPVTEERVRVERHAADRPLAAGETAFEEGTIEVPVYGEDVQLQKQVRVTGEVEIDKERTQREQQVSGTVRREEVRVTDDVRGGIDGVTGSGAAIIDPSANDQHVGR